MKSVFTIEALQNSAVARINPHLFEKKVKRSKFNNRKVELDNRVFDSKKEARRYVELRMLQTIGGISNLECQVTFQLSVCKYICDFQYLKDGKTIVEDVKSTATRKLPTYRLKLKMMERELGIKIKEV